MYLKRALDIIRESDISKWDEAKNNLNASDFDKVSDKKSVEIFKDIFKDVLGEYTNTVDINSIKSVKKVRSGSNSPETLVTNYNSLIRPYIEKASKNSPGYYLYYLYLAQASSGIFPKGVGPGECLLGILGNDAKVSGGSESFDLYFTNKEIEVKQGFIDKDNTIWNFTLGKGAKPFITEVVQDLMEFLEYAMVFESIEEGTDTLQDVFDKSFTSKETFINTLQKIMTGEISAGRLKVLNDTIQKIITDKALTIEAKIIHKGNSWIVFSNGQKITLSEFIGKFRNMLKHISSDDTGDYTDNKIMKLATEINNSKCDDIPINCWLVERLRQYLKNNVKKNWIIIDGEVKKPGKRTFKMFYYDASNYTDSIVKIASLTRYDVKPKFAIY